MKRFDRRFIAILLSLLMILSQMSATVFAIDEVAAAGTDTAVTEETAETAEPEAAEAAEPDTPVPTEEAGAPAEEPAQDVQEEAKAEEPAADVPAAAEPEEAEAVEETAFSDSAVVDGVKITVKADKGVFPAGATLKARKATAAEEKKAEAAVAEAGGGVNVMASYSFDISILDKDGNEIQPDNSKGNTKVSFTTAEVADSDLDTAVYHMDGREAEELNVAEKGQTATVAADGFSMYTVQFVGELTYNVKHENDSPLVVGLDAVLQNVGVNTGISISSVKAYAPASVEGSGASASGYTLTVDTSVKNEGVIMITASEGSYNIDVNVIEGEPHVHTWVVTPGTAIDGVYYSAKVKCSDSKCEYGKYKWIRINASGGTYNGDAYPANVTKAEGFPGKAADFDVSEITYKDSDGNDLTGAPVNAGTYTASVTISGGEGEGQTMVLARKYTIDPIAATVTITGNTRSFDFDGEEHTVTGYTATTENELYDVENDIQFSGTAEVKRTDVGSADMGLEASNFSNNNTNFDDVTFEVTDGSITISPKVVDDPSIFIAGGNKVYDGTPKEPAVTVKDGNTVIPSGEYNVSYEDNVKAGTAKVNITDKEGGNYEVSGSAEFTINPKALTITADSASKVFDGTPLTKDSYTVEEGALVTGDAVESVTVTGSQTEVGTSDNVASNAVIKNGEDDVTACYNITYEKGTLEVTEGKFNVTITANNATKVYDGTALTTDEYTATALDEGDVLQSVKITGSQTGVGSSDSVPSNAVIVNAKGQDVTSKYTINYVSGSLTVTHKELIITAKDASKVYDGEALTCDEYVAEGLAAKDSIKSLSFDGSQTDAGTSINNPSDARIVNKTGDDVTANYEITYNANTLTVSKRAITVTGDSASKVYDGTPLTKRGVSVTSGSLAPGQRISDYTVSGSQTTAGENNNNVTDVKIVETRWIIFSDDVTSNYEITKVPGKLTVTPKAVTITANSAEKVYDGTALTQQGAVAEDLADGDELTSVTTNGSRLVAGTAANTPSAAVIKNGNDEDVTESYNISYKDGTLEVTKKALTITADSASKTYDGSALTKNSYTNTELGAGDAIVSVTVTGTQTDVGSSDNVPSAAVIKHLGNVDVTNSYEITYENGTLEVTGRKATVTAASDSKTYDGTPLTKDALASVTGLVQGHTFQGCTVEGSQTSAGTSANVPSKAVIFDADGNDVTNTYDIEYVNGTLEVTPKTLTIKAGSATKVYDGEALICDEFTQEGLAEGDSIDDLDFEGMQIDVGKSANIASDAEIVNKSGEDVTDSYDITYVDGELEVTKRAITVAADSAEKVYDGTALTANNVTVISGELASGHDIGSFTVKGSQTAVGSSYNVLSNVKIVKNRILFPDVDVTANYEITLQGGLLNVTPKPVTVTANSAEKVYDGTALTQSGAVAEGLIDGDVLASVTTTGDQLVAGTGFNEAKDAVVKNADGENVTANYSFNYETGTLTVTKRDITITAASDSKNYDGTALVADRAIWSGAADGDTVSSVTVKGSQTEIGSSDNVPSAAVIMHNGTTNVTDSYNITYENGTLTVGEGLVTIKGLTVKNKTYDGTKDATVEGTAVLEGVASGDEVKLVPGKARFTDENVGNGIKVTFSGYSLIGKDAAKYTLASQPETVTADITAKKLTITADSDTKVYDGEALTDSGYTVEGLLSGDWIVPGSVKVTGSQTFFGDGTNTASEGTVWSGIFDGNVTKNYDIEYVAGTLKVTKKDATVTANSAEKVYDGTALTQSGAVAEGLIDGDVLASVTTTGNQTVAGTGSNVASNAVIKNAKGSVVTASYNIKYDDGALTVTKKDLTITADSASKNYDGEALTKNSFTDSGLVEGDSYESLTINGSQTEIGTSDNVPSAAIIKNGKADIVTSSYNITYVNGKLTVGEGLVTITGLTASNKEYDGTTDATAVGEAKLTGVAEGDVVGVAPGKATFADKNVGTGIKVTFSGYSLIGKDAAKYTLAAQPDTVTADITAREITIKADSDTKVYDGKALTDNGYTVTGLLSGDWIVPGSVKVTGSQTLAGDSANTPSDGTVWDGIFDGNVTKNYHINYENGTLNVTPKNITVTANSAEKVYDGTALTKSGAVAEGLVNGDVLDSVQTAGSRIVAGTGNNVASAAVIKNAKGVDVTTSYNISYENGALTVTKRELNITAADAEKVYDGTPLTSNNFSDTGLVEGDSYDSLTINGSQTEVGTSDNVPSAAIIKNGNGEDVSASYDITYFNGTLTVTKSELTIKADSDEKAYDGTPLVKNSYTYTGALGTGDVVDSVTITGSRTEVGTSNNVPSAAVIKNAAGKNVTASYTIKYVNGTLKVTEADLTITAGSAERAYDGKALTTDSYQTTGLADGDKITRITVNGEQTDVGESASTIARGLLNSVVIRNAKNDNVTDNYNISYASGTLKVTPRALTITAVDKTKVYDGTALTSNDFTTEGLVAGDWVVPLSVKGEGSQTKYGISTNELTGGIVWSGILGGSVTKNYSITYVDGNLEVTKKLLTIATDSDEKVYDGTPLTDEGHFVEGLVKADEISLDITGTQTNAGSSKNTVSVIEIRNDDLGDVTDCYDIDYILGDLEVTRKPIKITALSSTKEYDGEALDNNGYTYDPLVNGDWISNVTVTGSQTAVGTSDNVASAASIKNRRGEPVSNNYDITYVKGKLTVKPRTLKIVAEDKSKTYGQADPDLTYTSSGLLDGDSIIGELERDKGEATGTYAIRQGSLTAPDYYAISYKGATLTITADKTALNASIATAQSYYDSIKDAYPDVAAALWNVIQAAQKVAATANVSQTEVNNARFSTETAVKTASDNVAVIVATRASNAAAYTPAQVKLTKASKGSKKLTAQFKRINKNVAGYQVMATNMKTGQVKIVKVKQSKKSVKKVKKVVKGLAKKTRYNVQVRAYNVVGNETYFGAWSNVKSVTTR